MPCVVVAVVQLLSCAQVFAAPWTAAHQASLPLTPSWCLPKFMSIELVMLSNISSSVTLFFCLRSSPASESFPMSWLFASGGQSIGTSASVLPVNIQDLFPLGFTDLISLLFKGSQESSSAPHFQSIDSLVLCLLYDPTFTSVHDYWKNHSFDYMELCWHSDDPAF